jgi:hypothetical protein
MNITEEITGMDSKLMAAMQSACDRIAKGISFTKQERERAAAEIARIRTENARIFGIQDVVLDAVRGALDR